MKYFESSLEKVARILSSSFGVKVQFEGTQAYTDGKVINLPNLPSDDPSYMLDLNGYLDHETSHVIFTEFDWVKKVKNDFHKNLLNALEDTRIERLMVEKYPGTKLHLDPLNEKWKAINRSRWAELPFMFRLICNLRTIMEGGSTVPDVEVEEFYSDKVRALLAKANTAESTGELFKITREITDLLNEAAKEKDRKEQEQKEQGGKNEKAENGSQGEKGDKQEQGEQGELGEQGERGDKQEQGTQKRRGRKPKAASKKDSEKDSKESAQGQNEAKLNSAGDTNVPFDIHSFMDEQFKDKAKELRQEMENQYGHKAAKTGKHIPFTTKYDTVVDSYKDAKKDQEAAEMIAEMRPSISKIKTELEQILVAKTKSRWKVEQGRGRLNANRLHTIKTSQSPKIFKKREVRLEDDVAVTLLVDLSGSMHPRIKLAKQTLLTMCQALKELNIPYEALGFNTTPKGIANRPIEKGVFNRQFDALRTYVFKAFDSAQENFCLRAGGNNADGESLRVAARRLSAQKAKRKILIVFSDGMPAISGANIPLLAKDLNDAISEISKSGIECFGFGIQSDYVKDFYKDYCIVDSLEEFPKIGIQQLKRVLLKGIN